MNKKNVAVCIFCSVTSFIGGLIFSNEYYKRKYEKISENEIASVKESFSKKINTIETEISSNLCVNDEENNSEKNDVYKKALDYFKYSVTEKNDEEPYVILPTEFGEFGDYSTISLMYFADGYLADENYNLVEDINNVIGSEALNSFGRYEDDSVYVRNDKLQCDYEILLDQRNYADILESRPYLAEG